MPDGRFDDAVRRQHPQRCGGAHLQPDDVEHAPAVGEVRDRALRGPADAVPRPGGIERPHLARADPALEVDLDRQRAGGVLRKTHQHDQPHTSKQ